MAITRDDFFSITPELIELSELCRTHNRIEKDLYAKYDVKRGLRDINGKGVLAGLTEISEICSSKMVNGESVPCDGKLYYRGIDVEEIVKGFIPDDRFGFEEVVYLLMFGSLPNQEQFEQINRLLANYRGLPHYFTRDVILKAPSKDMMNALARSVLTLYSYDPNPDDTSLPNVLRQCLQLIAMLPVISVYSYQAYNHYHRNQSLIIHSPQPHLSTAENILYMLRPDSQYTKLEAKLLDMALVLHAEHGGGNNSSFTTHVVTSSGTDTYSAIAAALGSLKGPKHGGANIKVVKMFEDMENSIDNFDDEEEVKAYLTKLLHGEAFDKAGLIYGMGHAVYSISDPRARVFKGFVEKLSEEKGRLKEFRLYSMVERLAPEVIAKERRIYKGVSANVDFYTGFVYSMLNLPQKLFTPIFAIARIAGWSAHRMEELVNSGKIIRPAYLNVHERIPYTDIEHRT